MVKWITAHTIAPRPFVKKQRPRQQPPQCPLRIKRWSSWIFRHFCVVRPINSERVGVRSEEHTSELQSRGHLVCRLLLEKKKMTDGTLIDCEREKYRK